MTTIDYDNSTVTRIFKTFYGVYTENDVDYKFSIDANWEYGDNNWEVDNVDIYDTDDDMDIEAIREVIMYKFYDDMN